MPNNNTLDKFGPDFQQHYSDLDEIEKEVDQKTEKENKIVSDPIQEIIEQEDEEKRKENFNKLTSLLDNLRDIVETSDIEERKAAHQEWLKELKTEETEKNKIVEETDSQVETEEDNFDEIEKENKKERDLRTRKIWNMIYQVAGGITGATTGSAFAGGIITATGGAPVAIAGVFVAGTILFLKRKQVGSFIGEFMDEEIEHLQEEQGKDPNSTNLEKLEKARRHKEILTKFFTGLAGGTGAGFILGGASAVSDLVSSAYATEASESTIGLTQDASPNIEQDINTSDNLNEMQQDVTAIENFGEIGESINLAENMNLNTEALDQAIQEGKLLGPNLLLEGGTIAEFQGMFVEILNGTDLSGIDLNTPENTKTFLEGIYEINRQFLSGNSLDNATIEAIAQNTINSLK